MIRAYEPKDRDAVIAMGERFFSLSGYASHADFDGDYLASFLDNASALENVGVFVFIEDSEDVVGIIAAIAMPTYFNGGHTIAQELFWWVTEEARGTGAGKELLNSIEQWAHSLGVDSMIMTALEASNPEATGNLYKRRGYNILEHNYVKSLRGSH